MTENPQEQPASPPALIDRSMKRLIRQVPPAFFRLAGEDVDPQLLRFEDVTINLPEFRADQVLVVGAEDNPSRWAAHIEYQLEPDARVLRGWFLKNAALCAQLDLPVVLVVVYLTRGDYATFPESYTARGGRLRNDFSFHAIRLWEHADRIRSGELRELAPLLVLCEDKPTAVTLREERALIFGPEINPVLRTELLAVALTVGARYFTRDVLERLFREELEMLKGASLIEEWIEESATRGRTEGETRGRAEEAREFLLQLLRARFGELSESVVARIQNAEPEWCRKMAVRLLEANSLDELGLNGQ